MTLRVSWTAAYARHLDRQGPSGTPSSDSGPPGDAAVVTDGLTAGAHA
ncbi:hypothetical protein DSC45_02950 [Streptomyces sp. YIM 130001]|nr:hypothetical protein DSC45_02950 [Streptomyces sp. YIM 130001]